MGAVGNDYGSERHLLTYRKSQPELLDERILRSIQCQSSTASLEWLYPDASGRRGEEFRGVTFLKSAPWAKGTEKALSAWKEFWPQRGSAQSWDGAAILHLDGAPSQWLLIEAKANHPEFVGAPTRASGTSFDTIQTALNATNRHLGVHRHFDWTGSYYQFANRLAVMRFLNRQAISTTLVEIFFTKDRFPDGRASPASEDDWLPLLEARRLTLGLNSLKIDGVVDVFLDVPGH